MLFSKSLNESGDGDGKEEMNFKYIFPPANLCTDNAAMIAWAGIERYKKNLIDDVTFSARPRWPLDEKAPFLKGAGVDHS